MKDRAPFLFLGALAISALLLGTLGFHQLGPDNGWVTSPSWPTSLYLAAALFTLNTGGVQGDLPASLEFARWAAILATLGSVVAIALSYLYGGWQWFRLRRLRGHTIICGAGEKGAALAGDLLASASSRKKVVVIEKDEAAPRLAGLRQGGALVVVGDARQTETLASVGVRRAAAIVATAGADDCNLAVALLARSLVQAAAPHRPLKVFSHVGDLSLRDVLQRNDVVDLAGARHPPMRLFNFCRNRARLIFAKYPLEVDNRGNLARAPHLILPGCGPQEEALLVMAALVGHYREGAKVTVHLVGPSAAADSTRIFRAYPKLEQCLHLAVHQIEEVSGFEQEVARILGGMGEGGFATVYLGAYQDEQALAAALLLREKFRDCPSLCRVLVSAREDGTIRQILAEKSDDRGEKFGSWIKIIPRAARACGKAPIFADALDSVARDIHETWYRLNESALQEAESKGDNGKARKLASKPTFKPWDALTEEQKDNNRFAADHIMVKVRAVGLDPASPDFASAWALLSDAKMDVLCRMEHERWCAPYWLAGWSPGERSDADRRHDNLVPYDDLDEGTKKYDREQVENVPRYLQPAN